MYSGGGSEHNFSYPTHRGVCGAPQYFRLYLLSLAARLGPATENSGVVLAQGSLPSLAFLWLADLGSLCHHLPTWPRCGREMEGVGGEIAKGRVPVSNPHSMCVCVCVCPCSLAALSLTLLVHLSPCHCVVLVWFSRVAARSCLSAYPHLPSISTPSRPPSTHDICHLILSSPTPFITSFLRQPCLPFPLHPLISSVHSFDSHPFHK